jgi:hypothetical protein
VGVLRRDDVRAKILGEGACGLIGRLRMRKRAVEKNRMFTALAASAGSGQGVGRCAKEARRERNRAIARGIKIGAKKIPNVLILKWDC